MRRLALFLALIAVAVGVGFGAAYVAILAINAVLPPFRIEDDDTLRERIPVAITYAVWGLTTLALIVIGWRRSIRPG